MNTNHPGFAPLRYKDWEARWDARNLAERYTPGRGSVTRIGKVERGRGAIAHIFLTQTRSTGTQRIFTVEILSGATCNGTPTWRAQRPVNRGQVSVQWNKAPKGLPKFVRRVWDAYLERVASPTHT